MDIGTVFLSECQKRYAPLGFRRVGQTYARIVNDVLQSFTLKRIRPVNDCTVEFGVYPLCEGLEYPGSGFCNHPYSLCGFEVRPHLIGDFLYDRNSESSIESCVALICGYIDRHLLPLFEEANCSAKALPALIKLDEHFQNVRQTHLLQHGFNDMAMDWQIRSLMKPEKLYMALKCGQYEYAKKAAEVKFSYAKEEHEEYRKLLRSIIELIDAKDTTTIEDALAQREQQSLENLEKFRLKPMTDPKTS